MDVQVQFEKSQLRYLRPLISQVQTIEQVQELRLPDGMPDIGRVLIAWGQVLLRGKEWRNGNMGVSGGVMAWALYEPEEGGAPQTVEAWIPFQMHWDIPQTKHDGKIRCSCLLRSVDARSTSARKIMLRANVSVLGEGYIPEEISYYTAKDIPADVQLMKNIYPLRLAMEAGEKTVDLDEEFTLPTSAPKIARLIRFSLQPELIDRRVMVDKVVFRGMGAAHIVYMGEDEQLHSWDFEVPFSHYAELEAEYGPEAEAALEMAVTSLEMDTAEDGRLMLKGGMTCQYIIYDRCPVELVQDAYSPNRHVSAAEELLSVPSILDLSSQTVTAEVTAPVEGVRPADAVFYPRFPEHRAELNQLDLQGRFQLLYYDDSGTLQSVSPKWEHKIAMEVARESKVNSLSSNTGLPKTTFTGQDVSAQADLLLDTAVMTMEQIPMVTGLELGELKESDPNRPSLILRKPGKDSLWQMAKNCGSTVEKIRQANGLEGEPEADSFLLIPVL